MYFSSLEHVERADINFIMFYLSWFKSMLDAF
jgi:hypothetical protein